MSTATTEALGTPEDGMPPIVFSGGANQQWMDLLDDMQGYHTAIALHDGEKIAGAIVDTDRDAGGIPVLRVVLGDLGDPTAAERILQSENIASVFVW